MSCDKVCGAYSMQVATPTAVICGGDSGVKMADALSTFLGLRGNSSDVNRRDKLVQQEALKTSGLRFARSVRGTTWEEVGVDLHI